LKYLITALVAIYSFFAPIQVILLVIGLAIFVDTIVAIRLTTEKFSSRRLRKGLIGKMITYQSAVILFFLIDYSMVNDMVKTVFSVDYTLTKLVGLFLASIEVVSIDEKIRVKYGDDKGFIARFKRFISNAKKIKDSF
jgi:hypothetical protein